VQEAALLAAVVCQVTVSPIRLDLADLGHAGMLGADPMGSKLVPALLRCLLTPTQIWVYQLLRAARIPSAHLVCRRALFATVVLNVHAAGGAPPGEPPPGMGMDMSMGMGMRTLLSLRLLRR
jgi:hypothetical protein